MSDCAGPFSYTRHGPLVSDYPVIIAVPHAGREYPPALIADAAVPQARLRQLEDRYADRLVEGPILAGATAFIADRARAWIDLNRDPREIDPTMIAGPPSPTALVTSRARGGLGIVPRRIGAGTELWKRKFTVSEIAARIADQHKPYHEAIAAALAAARARFGIAVLMDCHSMPPIRRCHGESAPQIVIGDRFGRSAGSAFSDCVEAVAQRFGFAVARNAPYAGGHSADFHGRPHHAAHAIQIEIDRTLYLDANLDSPGPGLSRAQQLFAAMFDALAEEALAHPSAIAAE